MDERSRCLYCETLLMTVNREEAASMSDHGGIGRFQVANNIIKRILKDWQVEDHGRMQYLISSYFRARTLQFMYAFSRNDFKRGKGIKRALIQPLTMYSFLTIPWVIFNFIDTMFFKMIYNGYCEKCGWKYVQRMGNEGHSPTECEYSQEYAAIIDSILSGKIARNEAGFKRLAVEKIASGKRSAYNDLCAEKDVLASILDVMCIWFSVVLILGGLVALVFPKMVALMQQLSGGVEL